MENQDDKLVLENQELAPLFADEDTEPDPYKSTGAREREVYITPIDPDVRTLLGQIDDGSLILEPEFQRARVWDRRRQSRLIESLLLNIPIPPCFLAEDEDGSRVVVDGRQRLVAIDEFRKNQYEMQGLEVLSDLNDLRWSDLSSRDQRRIQQRVIRTVVILSRSDPEIRYEIFERLNTGGVTLTPQEIRNATLRGSFNNLLNELAHRKKLLDILGRTSPDPRLRHHELVLRFFALKANLENFRPPLRSALTEHMKEHRRAKANEVKAFAREFDRALDGAIEVFGRNAFRRFYGETVEQVLEDEGSSLGGGYEVVVSKAVFDLQMISLGDIPKESVSKYKDQIRQAFEDLSLNDYGFSEALSRATDHRSRFYLRMRRWGNALSSLGINPPFLSRIPDNA